MVWSSLPRSISYRSSFHSGTGVKSHYVRVKTKRYIARNLSQNGGCAYSLGRVPYSDWAFFRFLRPRGASKAPLVYPLATEIIHNNVLIISNSWTNLIDTMT